MIKITNLENNTYYSNLNLVEKQDFIDFDFSNSILNYNDILEITKKYSNEELEDIIVTNKPFFPFLFLDETSFIMLDSNKFDFDVKFKLFQKLKKMGYNKNNIMKYTENRFKLLVLQDLYDSEQMSLVDLNEIARNFYQKLEYDFDYDLFINIFKKTKFLNELSDDLQEELTIFRGVSSKSSKDGISFTLDLKVAKFFAERFNEPKKILKAKVNKHNILAYFENENEVIVEHKFLTNIEEELY